MEEINLTDYDIAMLTLERDTCQFRAKLLTEMLNKATEDGREKPKDVPDRPEAYEKLNWESRSSSKGPYQMLKKDNCNDTQLFNHLEAILKQSKSNLNMGDYYYWAGDEGYIFRRRKTQPNEENKQ